MHVGFVHVPANALASLSAYLEVDLAVCEAYVLPAKSKYVVGYELETGSNLRSLKPSALISASLSLLLA